LAAITLIFKIQLDYWLTVVGTVVTALAFGFGTFFVVIAVDAYAQLQAIRDNVEKTHRAAGSVAVKEAQLKQIEEEFNLLRKKVGSVGERLHASGERILKTVVDYALVANSKRGEDARKKIQIEAICIRSRFTIESEFSSNDEKRMAVLSAQSCSDKEALPAIKELLEKTEDAGLQQVCKVAMEAIESMR
jgi:hypothetical protein